MKQLILLLASVLFTLQLYAQIIIERSDYLLTTNGATVNSWNMATAGLSAPEEGADMTWDFSAQALTSSFTYTKSAISGDPTFPEANLIEQYDESFLGLTDIPVVFYERLDDNGFGTLGRISPSAKLPLQTITGGPTDTITLVESVSIYEETNYYVKFPFSYGDSWQNNISIVSNFRMTVAAFGLDNTPASQMTSFNTESSVVGYGTLILPNPDGSGSVSMDALLIRADRVKVDSFFLAGQPAPPVMLSVLGLQQGAISMRSTYQFYAKGLIRSALAMNVSNGQVNSAGISDDVKGLVSSSRFIAPDVADLRMFPNPTGGDFQVEFEKTDAQPWILQILNPLGQLVEQQKLEGSAGKVSVNVSLDENAQPGMFQTVLYNGKNKLTASGRVVVTK